MMKSLALATTTALLLVLSTNLQAAFIVADAGDDWDTYRNDGIDEDGNSVTAGSNEDAPQHGHPDTEGSGSWEYGLIESDNLTINQFTTWDTGDLWWDNGGDNWPRADKEFLHPDSGADNRAVRRWISGVSGTVTVSGEVARINDVEDDTRNGIVAMFFLNGTELEDERITIETVGDPDDIRTYNFDVSINTDDTLDFVVDPLEDNSSGDHVSFTSSIVIPEPTLLALLGLGGLMMMLPRRRRA